jgi:HTH-type transcriptional regulator/antitoxin HigA
MDMTEKHISHLVNGKVELTPDVALRLESVLGVPAKFWNSLEADYREKLARANKELELERDEEIAGKMPYSKMVSLKWLPAAKTVREKVMRLRAFFEVARLDVLESLRTPGISYRKAGANEATDYALACWAQKARLEARKSKVCPVNIDKLRRSVPDIQLLTVQTPKVFCARMREILSGCGVVIVFLPHIGGSFLHGATFADGSRIVIGLTVRGKYADKFWFSLFHELAHVIEGHVFSDGDAAAQERIADAFAQDTLIPHEKFQSFVKRKDMRRSAIISFAQEIGIAPGIVLGRLQRENLVPYSHHNELKEKYEIAL